MPQNLFPQYNQLNTLTNQNYSVARSWYNYRQEQFQKVLITKTQGDIRDFEKGIQTKVNEYRKYVLKNIHAAINGDEINFSGNDRGEAVYSSYINEIFSPELSHWMVNRKAGTSFERFMADNATSPSQLRRAVAFRDQKIDNVLSAVGQLFNRSWATKSRAETRTDLAYSPSGSSISNDDQLELISEINLEDIQSQLGNDQAIVDVLLQSMISAGNPNLTIYGFQLKTYSNLEDKRWMNSAAIAERIMNIKELFQSDKTWSSNYAAIYPTYYLSKYLINIFNPVNIGLITGTQLYWMTDILDRYRLYMEITWNKPKNPKPAAQKRGGGLDVFPVLVGNTILMRSLAGGAGLVARNGKRRQSVQYGMKEIKVASITHL